MHAWVGATEKLECSCTCNLYADYKLHLITLYWCQIVMTSLGALVSYVVDIHWSTYYIVATPLQSYPQPLLRLFNRSDVTPHLVTKGAPIKRQTRRLQILINSDANACSINCSVSELLICQFAGRQLPPLIKRGRVKNVLQMTSLLRSDVHITHSRIAPFSDQTLQELSRRK